MPIESPSFIIELAVPPKSELDKLKAELKQIEVKVDVRGLKNPDPATIGLAVFMGIEVVSQALKTTGKIQEMAKLFSQLVHSGNKEPKKLIITRKDGTKTELVNPSAEEIEKFLAGN
jgi:hypothetical protein